MNRIDREYKIGPGLSLVVWDDRCFLEYLPDYPENQLVTILFDEELDNLIEVLQTIKAHNKSAEQEKADQEKLALWNNNEQKS